jgi:protein-disulfide isomerase
MVGAAMLLVLTARSSSPAPVAQAGQPQSSSLLVREDSYRQGPPDAKVTLVEFLDPECAACRAVHPTVERIRKEYGDRILFVVRYFPLHKNSVLAMRATEAAGRQGKYDAMQTLLYETQPSWGEKSEPQTSAFLAYARSLGLDMDQFQRDLADTTIDDKINRDRADGTAAGVRGTPTFFINGTIAGNVMPYEQFKSKLDAALR